MSKKQTGPGLPDLGFLNEYVYGYNPNAPEANDPAKQSEFQAGVADWMARGRLKGDDKKDDFTGKREATNLEKLTGALLGVDTDDALQRAGVLVTQRDAKNFREDPNNKGIDFTKLSEEERNDIGRLREYADSVKAQRDNIKSGRYTGQDPLTTSAGELVQAGKRKEAEIAEDIFINSAEWKRTLDRDAKADAATLAQNELALAQLQGTLATAKMQNEQSVLDREYLDRRDQRDYDYRIKKDDQEQLDKIFALILGGVDKMF